MDAKLRKWGKITACFTPAGWGILLLVDLSGNPDPWMLLSPLALLLAGAGAAAAPVWLVWAWRRRHVFSRPPWALAALNAAALLAGLPIIALYL